MTDRPILFSALMVRALLAGTKTQTRRAMPKPLRYAYVANDNRAGDKPNLLPGMRYWNLSGSIGGQILLEPDFIRRLPFAAGDRLWVREAWAHYHTVNGVRRPDGRAFSEVSDGLAGYRADGHDTIEDFRQHVRLMSGCDLEDVVINGDRWRPSIHMPRWASRLTLTVTDVRVERLQDISEEDARAEGVTDDCDPFWRPSYSDPDSGGNPSHRGSYEWLWDSINGAGSWDANPWVAAYTFTVQHGNIDSLPRAAA